MAIIARENIPYPALAERIFPVKLDQELIPFLGAGVSASGRPDIPEREESVRYPTLSELEDLATKLELTGAARVFFSAAALLSCHLQARQGELGDESASDLFNRLVEADYPPTAAELAVLFSRYTNYSSLNEVVPRIIKSGPREPVLREHDLLAALTMATTLTGVGWPPDALSTIAAYFEQSLGRDDLWSKLQDIFEKKTRPTMTHTLLAKAAERHVKKAQAALPAALERDPSGVSAPRHYLILTTNYDLLMEKALEALDVPYVVLSNKLDTTEPQRPTFSTSARFSEGPDHPFAQAHPPASCGSFVLSKEVTPRVILYKIHGCLDKSVQFADEGLVISDNDYVSFISQKEALPPDVKILIQGKRLLFLGYSLNDWNVRSIFESIRRQRAAKHEKGDFCVTWRVKTFEMIFFEKNNINVLQTDLNTFSTGVLGVGR